MLGNGDGTFQPPVFTPRPQGALGSAEAADLNGDGILDVAAVSPSTNTVEVFLGNGDGTFQAPLSFAVDNGPRGLAVGDFNGDGFPDLATANFGPSRDVSVLINAADWSSQPGAPALPPVAGRSGRDLPASTPTLSTPAPPSSRNGADAEHLFPAPPVSAAATSPLDAALAAAGAGGKRGIRRAPGDSFGDLVRPDGFLPDDRT
jgi:hypothetical protein